MRYNLLILVLILIMSTGCKKFLDETPSEGGLVGFNDVSQFDALLNEIRITRNRYEWNHAIMGSDDCYYHPDFQTANPGTYQQREAFNVWNETELKSITGTSNGFMGPWTYMYTFNYITENIDKPSIAGNATLKRQVKGEAKFFRALYYFTMAVQYTMHPALNNGQNPGLWLQEYHQYRSFHLLQQGNGAVHHERHHRRPGRCEKVINRIRQKHV